MKPIYRLFCASSMVFAVGGCASTPMPRELLDARAAYAEAKGGPASQLTPASLRDAKVALDQAERAYSTDQDPLTTRDMAYIAERKSQLAEAQGAAAVSRQQAQIAMEQARLARAQASMGAQSELSQARQQLATTSEELAKERAAREAAEKKAQDALDKLAAASGSNVKTEPRGTVITMSGQVMFAVGKSDLLKGARDRLDRVVTALKDQGDRQILVEGHTDSQGAEQMNLDLSQRRADSVREYLISKGIPDDHVRAVGAGDSSPVATNDTAVGRAANRRVEIIVEPPEQPTE